MTEGWTDRITGARMQVDKEFQARVQDSEFTNQQWGLIMTAVEFRIDDPETPGRATLVADTSKVEQIIPELEEMPQGMGAQPSPGRSDDGLLGRLRGFLGGGSNGVDEETLAAATGLAEEYAAELQGFLENNGRWEAVCGHAAGE
jgi:hypothetical protein